MTGDCTPIHPLESTTAALTGFSLRFFPETDPLGVGAWLNDLISGLVNWLVEVTGMIRNFFVNAQGEGILINAFSRDIRFDGCLPAQPVLDCRGTGCSTVEQPRHNLSRTVNLFFYALPVVILCGLILLRRKRGQ